MSKSAPGKKNADLKPADENGSADQFDPFAYLFSDYDPETVVVTLARLSPEEWQGEHIKGYICDLSQGNREPWIKANYGGGKFLLNKRDIKTGRMLDSKTVTISGNPRGMGPSSPRPFQPGDGDGGGFDTASAPVMIKLGDVEVPYSGDLGEMQNFILFVKAVQSAFPPPPDINVELLRQVLGRREGPSTLELVKELKEASDLFGGGDSTGGNVYDLMKTVAEKAGNVLENMTAPRLRSPIATPPRRLPGPPAGKEPGRTQEIKPAGTPTIVNNGGDDSTAKPETLEVPTMGERDIVLAVANQLVKSFRLIPPKTPSSAVRMIDQFLQQKDATVRETLVNRYSTLVFDFCETELEADWSDPESAIGDRQSFADWFNAVFAFYKDSAREVMIL